jgi:hypothetical protein
MEAQPSVPAKERREKLFNFLGSVLLSVIQIGYLFYRPPTFSTWVDWAAIGGAILFPIIAIISWRSDPVETGIVPSLARPGGNITGVSLMSAASTAKNIELFRDMLDDEGNN